MKSWKKHRTSRQGGTSGETKICLIFFFKNHDICTNLAFIEIISSKGNGLVAVKILTFTI